MSDLRDELQVQIQYGLVEKLSMAQQRQAKLLEMLQECIFECDADFSLNYVNRAWTQRLGYEVDQLLGESLLSLIPTGPIVDALLAVEDSPLSDVLAHGHELQFRNAAGNFLWFELRITANESGGYFGSLFDVNSYKEIETQLRGREEEARRLSLVASHTSNLVVITDRLGRIEWVNESFERLAGFSREEVIGRKPGAFLQGPDTDEKAVAQMSAAVEAGRGFKVELLNYSRTGNPYWVAVDASPVRDAQGDVTHFIAIETDVTKRVEAERKAAESEYNYRSVVDNISEVVLRLHPNGKILFVNQAWRQILGRNESDCLGVCIIDFICPGDRPRVGEALHAYRQGARSVCKLDLQITRQDGSAGWVEMTMTPMEGGQRNHLTSIAATLIDVDKRVEGNRLLQKAKRQAEQLADEKSRFLANISHEIRTPLNAVIGSADILQETGLTREQQRYTDMIKTSGDALLSILDDVLQYSRVEAGGITVESHSFNLGRCIEEAMDIVSETALSKGLGLVLDIVPDLPLRVVGDNNRLRQIIINLLANAIKFTEQGQIVIRGTQTSVTDGCYDLVLEIEDSGIGINPHQLEKMFEPFVQSDVSTTRKYGGSGLGLAICRQICDAVGGSIAVESRLGVGSTFVVTFPLRLQDKPELPRASLNQGSANLEVGIVGGQTAVTQAVSNLLLRYQIHFRVFDAAECLRPQLMHTLNFLVVTDASQVEICRELLRPYVRPGHTACLLVVDLLGKGKVVNRPSSNEVHLNGPFKLSHLSRALESLEDLLGDFKLEVMEESEAGVADGLSYVGKTVLVVEDNQPNQLVVTQFLKHRGCTVLVAGHGVEALQELRTENVDLILMDIQMPVMDGLTTTRHIRSANDRNCDVPIIAVTADALHGDRERYLNSGMNDYLSKPLSRKALYECLDEYLLSTEGNELSKVSKIDRLRSAQQQLEYCVQTHALKG